MPVKRSPIPPLCSPGIGCRPGTRRKWVRTFRGRRLHLGSPGLRWIPFKSSSNSSTHLFTDSGPKYHVGLDFEDQRPKYWVLGPFGFRSREVDIGIADLNNRKEGGAHPPSPVAGNPQICSFPNICEAIVHLLIACSSHRYVILPIPVAFLAILVKKAVDDNHVSRHPGAASAAKQLPNSSPEDPDTS